VAHRAHAEHPIRARHANKPDVSPKDFVVFPFLQRSLRMTDRVADVYGAREVCFAGVEPVPARPLPPFEARQRIENLRAKSSFGPPSPSVAVDENRAPPRPRIQDHVQCVVFVRRNAPCLHEHAGLLRWRSTRRAPRRRPRDRRAHTHLRVRRPSRYITGRRQTTATGLKPCAHRGQTFSK